MKYCTHCGKELLDEAVICLGCGCSTIQKSTSVNSSVDYISELSKRVKINGIIWLCIAGIQILMAVTMYWFVGWLVGIVGILNLISAIKDLNYSQEILTNQRGIVAKFEPIAGPIITLV